MRKCLIASDHAGLSLKQYLIQNLKDSLAGEIEIIDLGPNDSASVDYPDYAQKLCKALLEKKGDFGILACGSGQGQAMTANRFKGIRAALCWDLTSTKLSREHNNANVLCMGARLIPFGLALDMARTFFATPFAGGRHEGRLQKMDK